MLKKLIELSTNGKGTCRVRRWQSNYDLWTIEYSFKMQFFFLNSIELKIIHRSVLIGQTKIAFEGNSFGVTWAHDYNDPQREDVLRNRSTCSILLRERDTSHF